MKWIDLKTVQNVSIIKLANHIMVDLVVNTNKEMGKSQ